MWEAHANIEITEKFISGGTRAQEVAVTDGKLLFRVVVVVIIVVGMC